MLETPRLILRQWRPEDRPPFARMNADQRVMEHLPALLNRQQSDALADRIETHFEAYGFGLFAAELRREREFIGFIGLARVPFESHFTSAVEIGWRLDARHWGCGLATEGAREAARFAFGELRLHEIVAMTTPDNRRSQRVMQKLGMTRDPADDFDHPGLPEGHPMRRLILHRLSWRPSG